MPQVPLRLQQPALMADGTFQFLSVNADGAPLASDEVTNYEALASTNLLQWTTLSNALTWSNNALLLRDPAASTYPRRFYRLLQH